MEDEGRRAEEHHRGKLGEWLKKYWAWLLMGVAALGLIVWWVASGGLSSLGSAGAPAAVPAGGGSSGAPLPAGGGSAPAAPGASSGILASFTKLLTAQGKQQTAALKAFEASSSAGQASITKAVDGLTSAMALLSQQSAASQSAMATQLKGLAGLEASLQQQVSSMQAAAQAALTNGSPSPQGPSVSASLVHAPLRGASVFGPSEPPAPGPYTPPAGSNPIFRPGILSAITGQVNPTGGGPSYSPWQALYTQLQTAGKSPTVRTAVVGGQSVTQVFSGGSLAGTFSNP
jgi:hypothetical protein